MGSSDEEPTKPASNHGAGHSHGLLRFHLCERHPTGWAQFLQGQVQANIVLCDIDCWIILLKVCKGSHRPRPFRSFRSHIFQGCLNLRLGESVSHAADQSDPQWTYSKICFLQLCQNPAQARKLLENRQRRLDKQFASISFPNISQN